MRHTRDGDAAPVARYGISPSGESGRSIVVRWTVRSGLPLRCPPALALTSVSSISLGHLLARLACRIASLLDAMRDDWRASPCLFRHGRKEGGSDMCGVAHARGVLFD